MTDYHKPVMLDECIAGLNIQPAGTYVDVTFGGGGHSKAILSQLSSKGKLIAFDQDQDALQNLFEDQRITLIQQNFRHLKRFLRLEGVKKVDGVLADLGISSYQIDEPERGFAFRFDAPIDMRMNQSSALNAAEVLNEYSEESLQDIFSKYGEVRNAKTLARNIVEERQGRPFRQTSDLVSLLDKLSFGPKAKYMAQVFQAIRMEVNDELGALKDLLSQSIEILKPKGRLVVMSYHSIEDRIVKRFMKSGNEAGELDKDFYGNISRPFKLITKKAILASEAEQKSNSRSRSAKLRIAEKI